MRALELLGEGVFWRELPLVLSRQQATTDQFAALTAMYDSPALHDALVRAEWLVSAAVSAPPAPPRSPGAATAKCERIAAHLCPPLREQFVGLKRQIAPLLAAQLTAKQIDLLDCEFSKAIWQQAQVARWALMTAAHSSFRAAVTARFAQQLEEAEFHAFSEQARRRSNRDSIRD